MILVVFNFNLEDFKNDVKILSAYRNQTTFNSGGDEVTDNGKLTAEDEPLISKYLKEACNQIAHALSGYTRNIFDTDGVMQIPAYEFDTTYDGLPNQVVFRINMPDTFIESNIDPMDGAIRDAIENFIIYRTAQLRGTEWQSYYQNWDNALNKVRSYLHLRYEPTKRRMNLF